MTTPRYTARCSRSGAWWAIVVPEVPGVYTQARRLDQAEDMARDAIALLLDVPPDSFDVEVHPELPADVEAALAELDTARREASDAQAHLTASARQAAAALVNTLGVTVRDAGALLGVSHQRVDQLLHDGKR